MTALPGERTRRRFRLRRSIIACLAGSVVLRCAESATGVLLGLYLAHIAASQYDISATVVGFVAGSAFLTELGGGALFRRAERPLGPQGLYPPGAVIGRYRRPDDGPHLG